MQTMLLITENLDLYALFQKALGTRFQLMRTRSFAEARKLYEAKRSDYILFENDKLGADADEPDIAAIKEEFRFFWRLNANVYFVALSAKTNVHLAVAAIKAGADDYLVQPLTLQEILATMARIEAGNQSDTELHYLRDQFRQKDAGAMVQTKSETMTAVYQAVRTVAGTHSTVLLTGETGVGKSLIARMIHRHSKVTQGPFISLHCGAIAESLLESELFGHEKGAFTGAVKQKMGRFELAHGGTLFMDEIGTISPSAQIKLLQVLQEGTFQRVGGETDVDTNARLISATNEDLEDLCAQGKFRRDLYYRLDVFPIHIPPLRRRKEDIPALVDAFISRLNQLYDKSLKGVGDGVIEALQNYHWPGNIRELENLVERAYILEHTPLLTLENFPTIIAGRNAAILPLHSEMTLAEARAAMLDSFERQYLQNQLKRNQGRINETAVDAGISVRQLHRLMRKYDLDKQSFKSSNNQRPPG